VFAGLLALTSGGCKRDDTEYPESNQDVAAETLTGDTTAPQPEVPDPDAEARADSTTDNRTRPGDDADATSDVFARGCRPGEGCILDQCDQNSDCMYGYCVLHMGEGACTMGCIEDCPAGWTCREAFSEPDMVWLCISDYANLCRPCTTNDGCKYLGGAEDVCVDYGAGMGFCGGPCTPGDEGGPGQCPWGFVCKETQTVDGIPTTQCVAEAGICPCTKMSAKLALWTGCKAENEWGTCTGKRICQEGGLTNCDAPIPAQELCNGLDDDCDGSTDEGGAGGLAPCDDGNACTADFCQAAAGCLNEPMTASNCDDGDACTITDHCEAGACVGSPIVCDDNNPCTDDSCGVAGCAFQANFAPCDDGNACTVADACSAGECAGTAVSCDCGTTADCLPFEDGDACNGTLECVEIGVQLQCQTDPQSVVECPPPEGKNAQCLKASCDPSDGSCDVVPAAAGGACEDGSKCTHSESCIAGSCQGGQPVNCNDGDPCTDDYCLPAEGCKHTFNQAPCDDGNICTVGDDCLDGLCEGGGAFDCSDENPCTNDVCNPLKGCLHTNNNNVCDDLDPCSEGDKCSGGMCVGSKAKDCSDGNPCTDDLCIPLAGCSHKVNANPCDDGSKCTVGDKCTAGTCIPGEPAPCGDGNVCTDDACDPDLGCYHSLNALTCNDANACTIGDKCVAGVCVGQSVIDCDDGNPCTKDGCAAGGGCTHSPVEAPCSDGNACTLNDTCSAGKCQAGTPFDCADGNSCTADSCDPKGGCLHLPANGACDDGNLCTQDDSCEAATCKPGKAVDCADVDVCTTDACDPLKGCTHTLNQAPCDDGDPCTAGDKCQSGICKPGLSVPCDDGNACTSDACAGGQCLHGPVDGACDDGNPCTSKDACFQGKCLGKELTVCGDQEVCTADSCDPTVGCVHAPLPGACDDGNACSTNDQCEAGKCKGGPAPDCEDGEVCTTDSCDPKSGCTHTSKAGACDDKNACTTNDQCAAGKCAGGPAPDCNDNNVCTNDSCVPATGCTHSNNDGASCDDGNPATNWDKCSGGTCQGSTNPCGPNLKVDPQQVVAGWTLCYLDGTAPDNLKTAQCKALFNSAGKTYGCWHSQATYPHDNQNSTLANACKAGVQNDHTYSAWGMCCHIFTVCIKN
jgi:hypothetical protein